MINRRFTTGCPDCGHNHPPDGFCLAPISDGLPTPAGLPYPYGVALSDVLQELTKARSKHAGMRGGHEGYAVILEELDELWDEVKKRTLDKTLARKEACQVAAMAVAFMVEVCEAE